MSHKGILIEYQVKEYESDNRQIQAALSIWPELSLELYQLEAEGKKLSVVFEWLYPVSLSYNVIKDKYKQHWAYGLN